MAWTATLRRFGGDVSGAVAMIGGFSIPVMVLGVGVAVEYGNLAHRHTALQKAVDAAALASAQQLRLSNTSDAVIDSVAKQVVATNAPAPAGTTTDVTTAVGGRRNSIQVNAVENVKSVIGKALTLPSSTIGVTATASISGSSKLCLLTLETKRGKALNLDKDSSVSANGCAIYSNSVDKKGLAVETNARATASLVCSAGGVENKGIVSPVPTTDCPAMSDPLASIPRPSSGLCTGLEKPRDVTASQMLFPGTYCGGLKVSKGAQATLASGVYVINNGPLTLQDTSSLVGTNVGFYFTGNAGGLRFDPDTTVSLTAPRDGPMAGLLFLEDRTTLLSVVPPPPGPKGNPPPPPLGSAPMREYRISSNSAPNLLGTIYLPQGRLIIDASRPVANASAYTVIVARQLEVNSGPNLVLNSDYGATDIPVPDGVGPKTGNVALTR